MADGAGISSRSRASSSVGTPRRPRSVSSDLEAHVLRMSFLREQRSSSTPKSAQPTLAQERASATKRVAAGHGTEVATSHDKGAEHSAEPSPLPWIVERLFFLSFVALIVYFAKAHLARPEQCAQLVALAELEDDGLPTIRSQLSQLVSPSEGTLILYLLYFSIEKASPHAPPVVVFTHALCLNSALLHGVRFGLLAAISAPAFGSFVLWSYELNRRMGGAPDEIGAVPRVREIVLPAIALHLWPLLAMLADLRLRWCELRRCYGRFHRVRWLVAVWLLCAAQLYVVAWTALTTAFAGRGVGGGEGGGEVGGDGGGDGESDGGFHGDLIYVAPRAPLERASAALEGALERISERISVVLAHVLGISEPEIRSPRYDLGPDFSLALLLSGGGALPAIALDLWLLRRWLFAPAEPAPSAELV